MNHDRRKRQEPTLYGRRESDRRADLVIWVIVLLAILALAATRAAGVW